MRTGAPPAERDLDAVAGPPWPASPSGAPVSAWLGRYRPVRLAALTRRGAVWEAARGERRYALKQIRVSMRASLAELEAEYRLGLELDHPNIARPTDWCVDTGSAAIAFDFLDGGDLTGLAGGPPGIWAQALIGLIDALGYLHGHGLVHRDVKARNVMLDRYGQPRLIDFGSCRPAGSRWTAGGTTREHGRADRPAHVTPADDVCAFAVLVDEMLRPDPSGPVRHGPEAAALAELTAGVRAGPDRDAAAALRAFRLVLESGADRSRSI